MAHFRSSAWYGINILAEGQQELSARFSERIPDRFGGLGWKHGVSSVPLLEGCLASMECSIVQTVEAGDHAIFIGEVIYADCREGNPLLYYGSAYQRLGG